MNVFEFAKAKDKENLRKHGLPLSTGKLVFDGLYFETVDDRRDYGEQRLITVGPAFGTGDKLLSVTYTWRERQRRLISVRQASGDERRRYHHRHTGDGRGGA